jgi:hypothetical protein
MTASPYNQSLYVNQNAHVTAYWYNAQSTHVVANILWGDGTNQDTYTCWVNCKNGQTGFDHVYIKRGNPFTVHLWMNGGGAGAANVYAYVS